jgi:hypothetical protein
VRVHIQLLNLNMKWDGRHDWSGPWCFHAENNCVSVESATGSGRLHVKQERGNTLKYVLSQVCLCIVQMCIISCATMVKHKEGDPTGATHMHARPHAHYLHM